MPTICNTLDEDSHMHCSKKRRLNMQPTSMAAPPQSIDDDMEDLYANTPPSVPIEATSSSQDHAIAIAPPPAEPTANTVFVLPGLGIGEDGSMSGTSEAQHTGAQASMEEKDNGTNTLTAGGSNATGNARSEEKNNTFSANEEINMSDQKLDAGHDNSPMVTGQTPSISSRPAEVLQHSEPNIASAAPELSSVSDAMEVTDHEAPPHELAAASQGNEEGAEWEIDSSPYSSDSSDTSSDSDSDDSEEYQMLDPAEQARRLMEDDGGSDDEGGKKGGSKGAVPRTHNEKPDEIVEKPNIDVTPEMLIERLGEVEHVVDNMAVVKAQMSGESRVVDFGSLLVLANRKVIGVVAELLGRVEEPLYVVRFTNDRAMEEDGVRQGVTVYYVPQHSSYVFTQPLKALKGSDASNVHDEEVGAEEQEFSDDEAETEHKRNLKQQKQARRAERLGNAPPSGRPAKRIHHDGDMDRGNADDISYDDGPNDAENELYKPLSRPANLQEMMNRNGPSTEARDGFSRGPHGSRGRDRHRGRGGDRGKGGGRGRGSHKDHQGGRQSQSNPGLDLSLPAKPDSSRFLSALADISLPKTPQFTGQPPALPPFPPRPPVSIPLGQQQQQQSQQQAQYPTQTNPYSQQQQPHYPHQQTQHPYQQQYGYSQWQGQQQQQQPYQAQQLYQQHPYQYQNYQQGSNQPGQAGQAYQQSSGQTTPSMPQLQPGAFVNPAFFAQFQQQAQNQGYQHGQNGSR